MLLSELFSFIAFDSVCLISLGGWFLVFLQCNEAKFLSWRDEDNLTVRVR